VEAVSRIGMVTRSSAAELEASGRREDVLKLGIYSNRYSFTLFVPFVLVLLVYGRELIQLWVGAEFAANSAPLLPILAVSMAVALAGQYNSSSLLFGLSKHGPYGRGLLVEAVINVTGMIVVIPKFGILGAAVVASVSMLLVRGLYTPWLVCRALDFGFVAYVRSIYLRAILTAIPILAMAYICKLNWIPGNTWPELIAGSCGIGLLYMGSAFFTCIEPEHRGLFLSKVPFFGATLRNALSL
jgi:O-antigen/teichoic acid export membrane protein